LFAISKTRESNAKTSVAAEKLMKLSPPTTWRPGVVSAVLPAKGSVANLNTVAFAAELRSAQVAAAQMTEYFIWNNDFITYFFLDFPPRQRSILICKIEYKRPDGGFVRAEAGN